MVIRPLVGFPGAALEAKRAVWRVWKIDWSWACERRATSEICSLVCKSFLRARKKGGRRKEREGCRVSALSSRWTSYGRFLGKCEHIIGRGLGGSVYWLLNDLPLLTLSCSMVVFVSPGYYRGPYFFMNAYLFFNRFPFRFVSLTTRTVVQFRVCSPDKTMHDFIVYDL